MVVVKDRFLIGHNPGHDPQKICPIEAGLEGISLHGFGMAALHYAAMY